MRDPVSKHCAHCLEVKPADCFHIQSWHNGRARLHAYCKACRREMSRKDRASKSVPCDCGALKYPSAKLCQKCSRELMKRTGPDHPSWKGGVTRSKKGYVMERHPETNVYVGQHRLIMEAKLGRPLLPEETVHHRNGVRDDNRVENLELWSSNQPSGQRVADKIAWAKEILALYPECQESFTGSPFR